MVKVLLMTETLVRRDQKLVPVSFGTIEQFPIAQIRPASLEGRVYPVSRQMVP